MKRKSFIFCFVGFFQNLFDLKEMKLRNSDGLKTDIHEEFSERSNHRSKYPGWEIESFVICFWFYLVSWRYSEKYF